MLRSSSTHEPNDPPHRVIQSVYICSQPDWRSPVLDCKTPLRVEAFFNTIMDRVTYSQPCWRCGPRTANTSGRPVRTGGGLIPRSAATLAAALYNLERCGSPLAANASNRSILREHARPAGIVLRDCRYPVMHLKATEQRSRRTSHKQLTDAPSFNIPTGF